METEETDRIEKIANSLEEINNRHQANRKAWNEAAEASNYTKELDKTIDFIRNGKSSLTEGDDRRKRQTTTADNPLVSQG